VVEGGARAGFGGSALPSDAEALVEEGEHGRVAAEPLGDAEEDDVGGGVSGQAVEPDDVLVEVCHGAEVIAADGDLAQGPDLEAACAVMVPHPKSPWANQPPEVVPPWA
jgi:hypothetical protein